jgi:hypothetical protein
LKRRRFGGESFRTGSATGRRPGRTGRPQGQLWKARPMPDRRGRRESPHLPGRAGRVRGRGFGSGQDSPLPRRSEGPAPRATPKEAKADRLRPVGLSATGRDARLRLRSTVRRFAGRSLLRREGCEGAEARGFARGRRVRRREDRGSPGSEGRERAQGREGSLSKPVSSREGAKGACSRWPCREGDPFRGDPSFREGAPGGEDRASASGANRPRGEDERFGVRRSPGVAG